MAVLLDSMAVLTILHRQISLVTGKKSFHEAGSHEDRCLSLGFRFSKTAQPAPCASQHWPESINGTFNVNTSGIWQMPPPASMELKMFFWSNSCIACNMLEANLKGRLTR